MPRRPAEQSPDPRSRLDDWIIPQQWERFSAAEHGVWDLLFTRQLAALPGKIVSCFFDGIAAVGLDHPGIPDLARLNRQLQPRTGWRVVAVPGLVPDEIFYQMLSERRFPTGNFIRRADQLDYLEEPDLFHDVFGHVPLLADPVIADLSEHFGRIGLEAVRAGRTELVARLYWHSVEFGLTREQGELRILGGGLASSFGEAAYCLASNEPERVPFELGRVVNTPYRIDSFQRLYFVADDLAQTAREIEALDFAAIARIADEHPAAAQPETNG